MSYIYYRSNNEVVETVCDENLRIEISHSFTESLHTFVWRIVSLMSGGSYCRWKLYRDSKVVSVAEVVSWLPIFKFMPKNGIHIGPCRTVADERGKGYYPYLLRQIVNNDTKRNYYMIVEESNVASIRGVMKAGFSKIGEGTKNRIGQYITNK